MRIRCLSHQTSTLPFQICNIYQSPGQVYNHIIVPGKKNLLLRNRVYHICTIKNEVNVKHVCTLVQKMLQENRRESTNLQFQGERLICNYIYKIMHMGGSLIISVSGKNLDAITSTV